jgi:hypothetical protein
MNLTGLHLLLTNICNYECDHCFVWGSPFASGTFTLADIRGVYDEAEKIGTIESIYFEGGEPFLYYPVMLAAARMAKERGFKVGIVTNGYFGTCVEDAIQWLLPVKGIGVDELSVSNDEFHYNSPMNSFASVAAQAAKELGLPVGFLNLEKPENSLEKSMKEKGEPIVGGGVRFKGRAVEKLTEGLPRKAWDGFNECPDEDFEKLGRVHLDPVGYVHICQGVTLGNFRKTPLSEIFKHYDPKTEPIIGPLMAGGPAELVRRYDVEHEETYVDACHLCYDARLKLRERFPEKLAPDQMYGILE